MESEVKKLRDKPEEKILRAKSEEKLIRANPEQNLVQTDPEKNLVQTDPEQNLVQTGWEKQATYDDPRLSEMVEMYKEIGLEVHLEPFDPENEEGCTVCMQLTPEKFKTIYTRKKFRN